MRTSALLLSVLATVACVPVSPANGNGSISASSGGDAAVDTSTQSADTLRGIVTIVGSDPGTWLVLQPSSGPMVSLSGAESLRSVSGADVWVSGRALDQLFEVERFTVRTVNDRGVHDGVVTRSGAGVVIQLTDGGRLAVPDAPPQLAALVGSRVWVTTPVAGAAVSFGVIAAP